MFKEEYVTIVDSMGTDLSTVNSARVSFAKVSEWESELNKTLADKDAKLINYLAKHHHWTPFAQNAITLRIKMPLFIRAQWFKHTVGFTRNEVSRRYVSDAPEFWTPTEWRMAAKDKKQGSSDEVAKFPMGRQSLNDVTGLYEQISTFYNQLIAHGVAPEMARMILPQSTFTEFVETASLAAYARLVKLRTTPDAQSEIRDYANRVSEIMAELFPVSWKALMEN